MSVSIQAITFEVVDIETSIFGMVVHLDHFKFEYHCHWVKVKDIYWKMLNVTIWTSVYLDFTCLGSRPITRWWSSQGHSKVKLWVFDLSTSGMWTFDWKAFLFTLTLCNYCCSLRELFLRVLIGLSYERPYLVLDLNLISNLHVTWRITLVNCWITLVNWQFTLVKYLISGLQVLLS